MFLHYSSCLTVGWAEKLLSELEASAIKEEMERYTRLDFVENMIFSLNLLQAALLPRVS